MNTKYKFHEDQRILVIDDDPKMRDLVCEALIQLGFSPTSLRTANNGVDALEAAKDPNNDFEFFIIDLVMPKMNGIELIRNLCALEKYKTTPKLVLSSESDANIILNAVAAGANSYMNKPIDKMTLANKLFECIAKL